MPKPVNTMPAATAADRAAALARPLPPRFPKQRLFATPFPWQKALDLSVKPVLLADGDSQDALAETALLRLVRLYRSLGLEPLVVIRHKAGEGPAKKKAGKKGKREDPVGPLVAQLAAEGLCPCLSAHPWQALARLVQGPVLFHPVDFPWGRKSGLLLLLQNAAQNAAKELEKSGTAEGQPVAWRPVHGQRPGWPLLLTQDAIRQLAQGKTVEELKQEPTEVADSLCTLPLEEMRSSGQQQRLQELGSELGPEEALALLQHLGCPERGLAHGRAVGQVAQAFAKVGCLRGLDLDPDLACAAGFVHDLAKRFHHHEAVGAYFLDFLGLGQLARCVRDHRDLVLAKHAPLTERELVYLADKYCYGPCSVPLEQRFGQKMALFGANPDAVQGIRRRLGHARDMEARLEKELGQEPSAIARAVLDC